MAEPGTVPPPTGAAARRGPFRAGDRVQLTDPRGRLHTITLAEGGEFHTHRGYLVHAALIGAPEGTVVESTAGTEYLALRPLLADYVLSMPRGAAVVYPKDAGQVVAMADIYPGARVVEAGVGSGALSMSLLRAVGDGGSLHSFERRAEFAAIARDNVEAFFGAPHPAWTVTVGDLVESLPAHEEPGGVDRVVLDMLAPWECLGAVATALAPGGVLICYVATASQLSRLAEDVRDDGRYTEPSAWESMVRGWHLEGLAVRPQHRMVGHTGFLLTTRRLADGVRPPQRRRRPAKGSSEAEGGLVSPWADQPAPGAGTGPASGEEDGQHPPAGDLAWDDEGLGVRPVSDRKVRRAARAAARTSAAAGAATAGAPEVPAGSPAEEQAEEPPGAGDPPTGPQPPG